MNWIEINTLCTYTLSEDVDKAEYIGATIQSNLKWDNHINNIYNRGNKTLDILQRNSSTSSTSVKEHAYTSLVLLSLVRASLKPIGPIAPN